jgi:RNA polymerase sigma-70 factor (sigma-E family)
LRRRNDEAFVEFAAASQVQMRRTAYLMCGDWQRASDIVQEALIRMYVAWPRLEKRGGLVTYTRRTVISAAIDMGRKRSNSEIPAVADDSVTSGVDIAGDVSERQALLGGLARLPTRQRACVVLRYFEDLPVSDVAAMLECSEGTVKSQTSRALSSLRTIFQAQGHDDLVVSEEGGGSW